MFWRILAVLLSIPCIRNRIITYALRRPYFHIKGEGTDEIYMLRYWVFNPYSKINGEWGQTGTTPWLPSIRLHFIKRPDSDRHLHDHPWNARTFILSGGYVEEREDDRYYRMAGDTARLNFGEFHRIDHVLPNTVTLFVMGKRRGEWGFKIPYCEYLEGVRK